MTTEFNSTTKFMENTWARTLNWLDDTQSLSEVEESLAQASGPAIETHVQRLTAKIGELDCLANQDKITNLIRNKAYSNGVLGSYEDFKSIFERNLGGIVFTAHPTFSFSSEAQEYFNAELYAILGKAGIEKPSLTHVHNNSSPSLEHELAQADVAVLAMRRAIRLVNRLSIEVALKLYPNEWKSFSPSFMTVASWVGFDLDGRTDISWATSLHFRYVSALKGISELQSLLKNMNIDGKIKAFKQVGESFDILKSCFQTGMDALADQDEAGLAKLNRLAVKNLKRKEEAIIVINKALDHLMSSELNDTELLDVAVLRAEWKSLGLGLSHIHFRLNAVQLHNAIRSDMHLDRSPDDSTSRRKYLMEITRLLDTVTPVQVHYGTLSQEQTTARRLFMLAAQFEKHFDEHTPIRLLVAESDTPFTLLTALYYAKLFNVEDHVEISPLFETAIGLQRGDRVINELVNNAHFLEYITKQGRFCVQLGFSDSGRFIGQPAAALAIERFKLRLVQLWDKHGLNNIDLVFFDTHGESIGRGAHPDSLRDRFLYTQGHQTRNALDNANLSYKHEVSFQGGDGYLWFQSEETTLGVLGDFLAVRLMESQNQDDLFYEDNGWSLDFFLTLKEFQDKLVQHPGYVKLLDNMAPNFLFPTGSRANRRQGIGRGIKPLESVGQVRAIPHNSMLQQLGYMANVLGGYGAAIQRAPDRFSDILAGSDRLERIHRSILRAHNKSDAKILGNYIQLLNPSYWVDRLEGASNVEVKTSAMALSRIMEVTFKYDDLNKVSRRLRRDATLLDDALIELDQDAENNNNYNEKLHYLHGLRISLIQFIFMKTMLIPHFSSRSDVSLDDLVTRLLALDIPETIEDLRIIFPVVPIDVKDDLYGEQSTYNAGRALGYSVEDDEIFKPIEKAYQLILTISGLIALEIGAFG